MNDSVKINAVFGSIKIITENRYAANGDTLKGGYSIRYNEEGVEISRTEWEQIIRVTNPSWLPPLLPDKEGLFSKIKSWISSH